MSNTHVNKPGDVVRHDLLGPGEWIVMEAALAGAGKSYCHAYPDAWKLNLRKLRPDGSIDWSLPRIIRYQDTAAFPSNMVLPYLQPLRQDRLALGLMTRDELTAHLRWIADRIEANATTNASVHYERLDGSNFTVSAAVSHIDGHDQMTSLVGQRYVPEKPSRVPKEPAA
jgi:hypothetical protein